MPSTAAPARMFVRGPTSYSGRRQIIALPKITALVGSRYRLDDPRFPTTGKTAPSAVPAKPGRRRGPTVKTLERLWRESGGDRTVMRRKLTARLRRSGLI
jgi:hypothetical protein